MSNYSDTGRRLPQQASYPNYREWPVSALDASIAEYKRGVPLSNWGRMALKLMIDERDRRHVCPPTGATNTSPHDTCSDCR